MATLLILPCSVKGLSEGDERLFPEIPVVDLVVITPMLPTSAAGPESFCFDNTQPSEVACDQEPRSKTFELIFEKKPVSRLVS